MAVSLFVIGLLKAQDSEHQDLHGRRGSLLLIENGASLSKFS
jgi:hypothetical protein